MSLRYAPTKRKRTKPPYSTGTWKVTGGLISNEVIPIAMVQDGPMRRGNAQRIVECVNACRGVNPVEMREMWDRLQKNGIVEYET